MPEDGHSCDPEPAGAPWALRAMSQASMTLTQLTGLKPLAQTVCDSLAEHQDCGLAMVGVLDSEPGHGVRIIAQAGEARGYAETLTLTARELDEASRGPIGQALRGGRPLVLQDLQADSAYAPWRDHAHRFSLRSMMAAPLHRRGRVRGVLAVYGRQPKAFDATAVSVFERLAEQLVLAMTIEDYRPNRSQADDDYRRLFENAPDAIVVAEPQRGVIDVNPAFTTLTGRSRAEVLGLSAFDLLEPRLRAAKTEALRRLFLGNVVREETEIRRPDGEIRFAEVTAVRTQNGRVKMFLHDITHRKRAEAEQRRADEDLRQARAELIRISRIFTVGEIAATIAHEINQPLAAVVTNSEAGLRWLSRDPPEAAEARNAFERICRDSQRAAEVIRRIRRFADRDAIRLDPLDLNAVAKEVAALVSPEAARAGVQVLPDLQAGLPWTQGDKTQIQQALLNLCMNAVEAFQAQGKDGGVIQIVTRQNSDSHVEVSVTDNGPGLGPLSPEAVFEPYVTTRARGAGLGLSLVRSIIEDHGGRIWAQTAPGGGALFRFTLPTAQTLEP